ncbi:hypothetical protein [Bradyrhizobium sp. Ash2021]|uniref:hypothetical protein n=1 Tax=Bradyrhizobium sp. Ash2021 TaxID=2954771 RepID=UPI0028151085|nr:hypothetical protein [Bradyrhizobium sp. Ash2021]WMT75073.1 hypothetical protein NL528_01115 [Bradyrhizobium sp. Ash2021]
MAHEHEDQPTEYVGRDQTMKADPKGAPKRVAVYTPPAKGEAHPKIARLGPALRLDNAEADLTAAQLELNAAVNHLRSCELIEAAALTALIAVMPRPSQDEVYRAHIAKEQAAKMARVAQGLPAVEPPKPSHGRSAVDIAAAQRPRTSQAMPTGTTLRSPISRRIV